MKLSLLPFLRCPTCARPLQVELTRRRTGEIASGVLRCSRRHRFPIHRGIPRIIDERALDPEQRETRLSFSAKWSQIPNFGHDPKARAVQLRWYLERFGWKTLASLKRFLRTRARILEAGTGTGPLVRTYAESAGGEVFGLDISPAVDSVYRHLGHLPNLDALQADLRRLPFPRNHFDFIVSDQVLHHTPDTESSFKMLVRHLRPGGQIAAYVYVRKGPIREFCDDYIRKRTVGMTPRECFDFSRSVTHLGKALSDLRAEIRLPEPIPILGIAAGRHDVQRLFYWNFLKCFWNADYSFETNVMINFDWYHPLNAHRHTPRRSAAGVASAV